MEKTEMKISVEQAKQLLMKDAIIINNKQAKEILDFLQVFADVGSCTIPQN